MTNILNAALAERARWPYAVSTQMPGEPVPTVAHFDHLGSATLYATLLDTPGNNLRRYVANVASHILYSSRLGWTEVGTFDPALCHEVRATEARLGLEAAEHQMSTRVDW